ncbi:MAG: hypothetical protein IPP13_26770 [Kouleothrix sp.]|nr:hypothetical protein [Kouleothrix sp.]
MYNEDVHDPAPVRRCLLLFDLLFTLPGAPIKGLWLYYRIAGGIDEKSFAQRVTFSSSRQLYE